jgi:hypothetical protein
MAKRNRLYPTILFHFTTRKALFKVLDESFSISYACEIYFGYIYRECGQWRVWCADQWRADPRRHCRRCFGRRWDPLLWGIARSHTSGGWLALDSGWPALRDRRGGGHHPG